MLRVICLLWLSLCAWMASAAGEVAQLRELLAQRARGRYLLAFTSPSCTHCVAFEPVLRDLEGEEGLPPLFRVSCAAEQELCYRLGITGVPRLVLYKDGRLYTQPMPYSLDTAKAFALRDHVAMRGEAVPDLNPGIKEDTLTAFKIILSQTETLFRRGNPLVKVLVLSIVVTLIGFVALFVACLFRLVVLIRQKPVPRPKIE